MPEFNWKCPFCNRDQVVTKEKMHSAFHPLFLGETALGDVGLKFTCISCASPNCRQVYIASSFTETQYNSLSKSYTEGKTIESWVIRPSSTAKHQPEYIPAPLREDYMEACAIRSNSPKASATLARRCLQGMIRDFCGISKSRLIDEINELRKHVDEGRAPKGVEPETVDAIDAVRSVGNIGAHMEKDISLILEVDPDEAQTLIELIEMLFKEWYVSQHERTERLNRIMAIADTKSAQKKHQSN